MNIRKKLVHMLGGILLSEMHPIKFKTEELNPFGIRASRCIPYDELAHGGSEQHEEIAKRRIVELIAQKMFMYGLVDFEITNDSYGEIVTGTASILPSKKWRSEHHENVEADID